MNERGQTVRRAEIKASGDFRLMLASLTGNTVMQRFMDELVAHSLVIALYGQSAISSCGHQEHQSGGCFCAEERRRPHLFHIEKTRNYHLSGKPNLMFGLFYV